MDKQAQHMNQIIRRTAGRLVETPNDAAQPGIAGYGTVDGGAPGTPMPPSFTEIMNKLIRDAAGMPGRSFSK